MRYLKITVLIVLISFEDVYAKNLSGDVGGYHKQNQIMSVGGQSAASIAQAVLAINRATSLGEPDTIVKRDSNGGITAQQINIVGVPSESTSIANKDYVDTSIAEIALSGDVSGELNATIVNQVGGKTASQVAQAVLDNSLATSSAVVSTLVKRDLENSIAVEQIILSDIKGDTGNQVTVHVDNKQSLSVDSKNFVISNILCNNSVQLVTPINNDIISANSSILLLVPNTSIDQLTINFPENPVNGQMFTILLGANTAISVISNNTLDGKNIVNGISSLNAALSYTKANYFFYENAWYHVS